MLHEIPEILVVLNHPIWDLESAGKEKHLLLLKNFIKNYGKWIHAFEDVSAVIYVSALDSYELVCWFNNDCS